jgi:hypothetical protein
MRIRLTIFLIGMVLVAVHPTCAQGGSLGVPKTVEAGSAFSVHINGSGKSILYIVGPGQALMRSVQKGETVFFPVGSLYNVGHYLAIVGSGSSAENGSFDVVSATQPASISFLAKPSRLGVGLKNGISGAVYVFDAYHNLIIAPTTVFFQLSDVSGTLQKRTVVTHDGAAWTEMDSTDKAGIDTFEASVDGVSSTRVIEQVPGDPCGLKMSAKQSGKQLLLKTDMVRDCSGNSIPDGTIVTFTENYNGTQSTVDMPIKHGIAQVEIVAHNGAKISVASGVVLGNEIDWKK